MDDPKTRREKKGRDKEKPNSVYSSRHIREQERVKEKRKEKENKKNSQTQQEKKIEKNF